MRVNKIYTTSPLSLFIYTLTLHEWNNHADMMMKKKSQWTWSKIISIRSATTHTRQTIIRRQATKKNERQIWHNANINPISDSVLVQKCHKSSKQSWMLNALSPSFTGRRYKNGNNPKCWKCCVLQTKNKHNMKKKKKWSALSKNLCRTNTTSINWKNVNKRFAHISDLVRFRDLFLFDICWCWSMVVRRSIVLHNWVLGTCSTSTMHNVHVSCSDAYSYYYCYCCWYWFFVLFFCTSPISRWNDGCS